MAEQKYDALRLDPNMALGGPDERDWVWHSPEQPPFVISGFAWRKQDRVYRRMPLHPNEPLPPAVDALANHTAGGQIRFRTDSSRLAIRVRLSAPANMYHMPATGQCGFDCYIGEPGSERYIGTSRFDPTQREYEWVAFELPQREMRTITLYFPLYQGVEKVLVGVEREAAVAAPPPYKDERKVVVYGTSITQGGCASRPGMAYTNILSRRFPYEFVNLGFSGSGKGEAAVARTIASIERAAMFVLDYEANTTPELLRETLIPFIEILREKHPDVPILVVSKIEYAKEYFYPDLLERRLNNCKYQKETVERLRSRGDRSIDFCDGGTLLGDRAEECTVDGTHPTDLGFQRIADGLAPYLAKWLS